MFSVYADLRNNWETGNYDSSIHQAWRETAAPSKKSKVCTNLLESKILFQGISFLAGVISKVGGSPVCDT